MSNYAPALNQREVSDDGIWSSFAALGFSLVSVSGTPVCYRDSTLTLELGLLPSAHENLLSELCPAPCNASVQHTPANQRPVAG